jgi:hypothetical protein
MRISFCDVDVTFLHSKITTSCKILISHLLHCKTSLVFGDVGLMSHFCVTFVVQNLWGYLGKRHLYRAGLLGEQVLLGDARHQRSTIGSVLS